MSTAALCHQLIIHPAFHDLDPMGIVWHGHYPKYLETVRCALLQRFHYDYPQMRDSGYAWPIVDMRMKYVRSIQYGRPVQAYAAIVEWENRLKIDYVLTDLQSSTKLHVASTVQVAVEISTGEMCYVCPVVLQERLGIAQ